MEYKTVCFLVILSIAFAVQQDSYEDVMYRLEMLAEGIDMFAKNCTNIGYMCDDCNHLAFCFRLPNGTWVKSIEECTNGKTCREEDNTATCSSDPNPDCDSSNYEFVCYERGTFPDPYNCSKYYECRDPGNTGNFETIEMECDNNLNYDPVTTLCRINSTCAPLVKPCTQLGEVGRIPKHPSMYYVCLPSAVRRDFHPQMFLCADDKIFTGKECIDPKVPYNVNNGTCTQTGTFYFPDCKSYNKCTQGSAPDKVDCPAGEKFDLETSKCVPMTC